ncbi:M24 family metallopeptidase [Halorubrum pallidum]
MIGSRSRPPLRTDLSQITESIAAADADAFVAVGDRFDDDLRYLTRVAGSERTYALVVAPADDAAGRAVCCVSPEIRERAEREFVSGSRQSEATEGGDGDRTGDTGRPFRDGVAREVRTDRAGDHAGERAAAVVRDLCGGDGGDRTLLVPASIPHDAAVYLERAGNELASTDAVATARSRKTNAELDRLRRVQRAAAAGVARAEAVLAESEVADAAAVGGDGSDRRPALRWDGAVLTAERLRRAVNAALAAEGVGDAGDTTIDAGRSPTDHSHVGTTTLRPGETVVVGVSPRGPDGYRGDLTRTFVVDGDGGWERRASVAVEAAREVALGEVEPGVPIATVGGEAAAELAAYGFDPNAGPDGAGATGETVHGVGMSRYEAPSSGTDLRAGHVIAVETGVRDPTVGRVCLGDLVAVSDDGCELLAGHPLGITPETR